MRHHFPKAERLGLGEKVVQLSIMAYEQLGQFGLALCGMDAKQVGPITDRQRHAAEFQRIETLLADPVERKNFVHTQPS